MTNFQLLLELGNTGYGAKFRIINSRLRPGRKLRQRSILNSWFTETSPDLTTNKPRSLKAYLLVLSSEESLIISIN